MNVYLCIDLFCPISIENLTISNNNDIFTVLKASEQSVGMHSDLNMQMSIRSLFLDALSPSVNFTLLHIPKVTPNGRGTAH